MTADNFGDNADKTANPQNAGGAAQEGADAPVFMSNSKKFMEYFLRTRPGAGHGHEDVFVFLTNPVWWLCLGFALLYGLVFAIAGSLFPQSYQAWLDFCMPLAEYVGGLTPRAAKVSGELIAGGYPERVDDALHGIAMAKVLIIPVFICTLAGCFSAVRPPFVYVSCTRWTQIKVWLRLLVFGLGMSFTMAACFYYFAHLNAGEEIGDNTVIFAAFLKYYRGNIGMMVLEVPVVFIISMFIAMGPLGAARLRLVRFTIVKQPPGDKS